MAILDANQIYSDHQAITATAVSTNAVDLYNPDVGFTNAFCIAVRVSETFTNLTNLTIALTDCATVGGSYAAIDTVPATLTVPLAGLTKGAIFAFPIPYDGDRYTKFSYTVVGTAPDAGTIHAAVEPIHEKWYKDAQKLGGHVSA